MPSSSSRLPAYYRGISSGFSNFGYPFFPGRIQKHRKHMTYFLRLSALLLALGTLLNAQTQSGVLPSNPADAPKAANSTTSNPGANQEHDPLLDLPPLPQHKVTLIGGTVTKFDPVLDKMTVRPFGHGKPMRVEFDVRTRVIRDGVAGTQRDIKTGDRVYLDTMLNGTKVFAKTIWVQANAPTGNGRGQVVDYDSGAGLLTVRDELSQQPVRFRLTPATVIRQGSETRSVADLAPGTLVDMSFGPRQERFGTIREISVLARPGTSYSFFGKLTFVDLSRKMIAVANDNDGKTYDIFFESMPPSTMRNLRQGSEVGISAVFDGTHYVASSVAPAVPKPAPDEQ